MFSTSDGGVFFLLVPTVSRIPDMIGNVRPSSITTPRDTWTLVIVLSCSSGSLYQPGLFLASYPSSQPRAKQADHEHDGIEYREPWKLYGNSLLAPCLDIITPLIVFITHSRSISSPCEYGTPPLQLAMLRAQRNGQQKSTKQTCT